MGNGKYKAFISYSHADAAWAKWLHVRLEKYRFPKQLRGQITLNGQIPENLKPIFRDREDLSAGASLGDKIEAALDDSENLIVICSPNSARSKWVNEEVLYFKRRNRSQHIYAVIIDGEPFSDSNETECLPAALRFDLGDDGQLSTLPAEPLASDLRDQGDGKRLGLIKLIAGMAGLELDDLIQRDLQRSRQRVTFITLAASIAVLSMGTLSWFAFDARKDAEARRADAEGLIEFMLTDLRYKLEPVGRLDVLESVGQKASEYYDELQDLNDDALGQRARVFHLLGQVQFDSGNTDAAVENFQKAFDFTERLLLRDADNPDRVFEHSQSAYWVGHPYRISGQYDKARKYFAKYRELSLLLQSLEPDAIRSIQEVAYSQENLGLLDYRIGRPKLAQQRFSEAVKGYREVSKSDPKNTFHQIDLANGLAWLSDSYIDLRQIQTALDLRYAQKNILEKLERARPQDYLVKEKLVTCYRGLIRLELLKNGMPNIGGLVERNIALADEILKREAEDIDLLEIIVGSYLDVSAFALLNNNPEKSAHYLKLAQNLTSAKELPQSDWINIANYTRFYELEIEYVLALHSGAIDDARGVVQRMQELCNSYDLNQNLSQQKKRILINCHLYLASFSRDQRDLKELLRISRRLSRIDLSPENHRDVLFFMRRLDVSEDETSHLDTGLEFPAESSLFRLSEIYRSNHQKRGN